jgi:hypothetical protein
MAVIYLLRSSLVEILMKYQSKWRWEGLKSTGREGYSLHTSHVCTSNRYIGKSCTQFKGSQTDGNVGR